MNRVSHQKHEDVLMFILEKFRDVNVEDVKEKLKKYKMK